MHFDWMVLLKMNYRDMEFLKCIQFQQGGGHPDNHRFDYFYVCCRVEAP